MAAKINLQDVPNIDQQAAQSEVFSAADTKRATELANTKTMETISQNALVKEAARLTAKYGKDDPRVQVMNTRIGYGPSIQKVLDAEITRVSNPVNMPAAGGWLVDGIVYGSDGKVASGVTVFLTEDKKSGIQGVPSSCTTGTGFYSISLTSNQVDQFKGKELYLAVSDANQRLLYTDSEKASDHLAPDGIYGHNLMIGGGSCVPPPGEGKG